MPTNPIFGKTIPNMQSKNGLRKMMFWGLVWYHLRSCLREAPGPPKSLQNHTKNISCVIFFMHFCTCCSIRFVPVAWQVEFTVKVIAIILAVNSTC